MEELYQHLKSLTKKEVESYLVRIRAFLESEPAQKFSRAQFDQILADALNGL